MWSGVRFVFQLHYHCFKSLLPTPLHNLHHTDVRTYTHLHFHRDRVLPLQLQMMKRNCNLDLRLASPSDHQCRHSMLDPTVGESPGTVQNSAFFYNGRFAACDATELQARAIIRLASGEKEDQNWKGLSSPSTTASQLSMKRSLQRFLQKRKARAQSVSPYSIPAHHIQD